MEVIKWSINEGLTWFNHQHIFFRSKSNWPKGSSKKMRRAGTETSPHLHTYTCTDLHIYRFAHLHIYVSCILNLHISSHVIPCRDVWFTRWLSSIWSVWEKFIKRQKTWNLAFTLRVWLQKPVVIDAHCQSWIALILSSGQSLPMRMVNGEWWYCQSHFSGQKGPGHETNLGQMIRKRQRFWCATSRFISCCAVLLGFGLKLWTNQTNSQNSQNSYKSRWFNG